jgi:hypothetical protein
VRVAIMAWHAPDATRTLVSHPASWLVAATVGRPVVEIAAGFGHGAADGEGLREVRIRATRRGHSSTHIESHTISMMLALSPQERQPTS